MVRRLPRKLGPVFQNLVVLECSESCDTCPDKSISWRTRVGGVFGKAGERRCFASGRERYGLIVPSVVELGEDLA